MANEDEVRHQRDALKRAYRSAYERLNEILFREDPIGINFHENTDEYEPEVGTILPRLHDARSVDEVRQIVHDEFTGWFDTSTAGPPERYQVVAARIWDEVVPLLRLGER